MNNYLLKFGGDLGTKRSSTRWMFIKKLAKNISRVVLEAYPTLNAEDLKITCTWDNIRINCSEELMGFLERISGVANFSRVETYSYSDFETMVKQAAEFFQPKIQDQTFAVRCKKVGNYVYDFSKLDAEREIGSLLDGKVDLSNPEFTCRVVVDKDEFYLHHNWRQGTGGLPVGVLGKSLCLYSGGIDSPVAAWHGYRSGMYLHFLYFDLGGAEQKQLMFKSVNRLHRQWGNGSKSRLVVMDFNPIIQEILKADRKYQNLILKYFFYKAADKIADILYCDAIVTGEALGQVSTQTLKNLAALDKVADKMIIRPLATLPKLDIIAQAKQIGTMELAYTGKEYCALVTKNVVTASTYTRLEEAVAPLDQGLIDRQIEKMEIWRLWQDELPVSSGQIEIPKDVRVIDLRSPEQFAEYQLEGAQNINFQEAWNEFIHWDKDEHYFLVCDVGAQSMVLKEYMRREGFKADQLEGGIRAYRQIEKKEGAAL